MDLNNYTLAELHASLSILVMNLAAIAEQCRSILNTEKFDAVSSHKFMAGINESLQAANKIFIESLKQQGLTDQQIQNRISLFRDYFGNE